MTFAEAAAPLAQFLANVPVRSDVHKNVLADLYDLVNAIRDEQVNKAEAYIDSIVSKPGYEHDDEAQALVIRIQAIINAHQGG